MISQHIMHFVIYRPNRRRYPCRQRISDCCRQERRLPRHQCTSSWWSPGGCWGNQQERLVHIGQTPARNSSNTCSQNTVYRIFFQLRILRLDWLQLHVTWFFDISPCQTNGGVFLEVQLLFKLQYGDIIVEEEWHGEPSPRVKNNLWKYLSKFSTNWND